MAARIRTIKPALWTSTRFVDCSHSARLLYIGIWNFCDDKGNHPAHPKSIKGEIFGSDDVTIGDVEDWLDELIHVGLLTLYETKSGRYLHVNKWDEHQRIDRPHKPRYPSANNAPKLGSIKSPKMTKMKKYLVLNEVDSKCSKSTDARTVAESETYKKFGESSAIDRRKERRGEERKGEERGVGGKIPTPNTPGGLPDQEASNIDDSPILITDGGLKSQEVSTRVGAEHKKTNARLLPASLFCEIPLNDGSTHSVSHNDIERWKRAYPDVDVEQQVLACQSWNLDNKRRRKTPRGITRHINTWLASEQDTARSGRNKQEAARRRTEEALQRFVEGG